jgi:hypothetical protein
VKVHLRRWLEDEDAWTLARYICFPHMQREVSGLYKSLQIYQLNSTSLIPEPDQALRCGFPCAGPTTVQGVFLRMPGPTPDNPRWLVLRIERCSAPFPFGRVIVDRDNNSTPGKNVENENLMSALTNSLSFANSEFTFSNNLRLNIGVLNQSGTPLILGAAPERTFSV